MTPVKTHQNRPLALSVLDLIPVRSGQTSGNALAASVALAQMADRLGFTRYWVAEHHNMQAVASTNPPVLMGILAARTERIRVGSGGIMLPNHSPLVIAEQLGILEAAFPGRIDVGFGRAPGSDPVISSYLRSSGAVSDVDAFEHNVADIGALLHPDGAALRLTSGQDYVLRATPAATGSAVVWMLGSSSFSAHLAARLGLPYVFANHFSGDGTTDALNLYRTEFTPSENLAAPRTFLTVNVSVADTAEEALALATPQLQLMARLRTGAPMGALLTVEQAAVADVTGAQAEIIEQMVRGWVIDTPAGAATRLHALADRFGVDEIMVVPGASEHSHDDLDTAPARVRALELLAAEVLAG
ncbi:LLM class flavin-dependent oxidoreductase [Cryobacterium melibiosiphilum]|uniref:LLM class flavin-dependent oxidoreductase n=1 Tax=Cryobacterium melibiosiphilum TaxID=995039 RepID=A0A3A5MPA7_9MICO|nr:LLM class flavin-dependent oxidoreductase [Cryobacterium melibiosiphilum]RJT87344.1 LLM class flavin-dependent oxidoreductase [Cryobacterium melibiosiphilum]